MWRDVLLPPSETFIFNQVSALANWSPVLAGLRQDPRATFELDPGFLLEGRSGMLSRVDRWIFWRSGASAPLLRLLRTAGLAHAHFGPDATRVLTSARLASCPLIVTFHGYDITVPEVRAGNDYERLFRQAARIVAVSEFIRDQLELAGAPPEKIRVLPIGIPVPGNVSRTGTAPQVLFVGRLVEKKGCADLLEALSRLPNPPRLTVIGDGPLRQGLEARAAMLGVAARFIGVQPPEVVDREMRRATVFCVPSKRAASGDSEGFGLAFIEASARMVPVVSYASGGVPEAVRHGETGLLAPEGDVDGLASCLNAVLGDSEFADRLGSRGRRRVERLFDLEHCTQRLECLYDEVVRTR